MNRLEVNDPSVSMPRVDQPQTKELKKRDKKSVSKADSQIISQEKFQISASWTEKEVACLK